MEYSNSLRRSMTVFPGRWGPPPSDTEERAQWAAGHIRRENPGAERRSVARALTRYQLRLLDRKYGP